MRHKIWQRGRTILPLGNGFAMRSFTLSRGANTARPIRQRKGDVLAMRWSDVENGFIRVKQSKTGAELFIPIHPTLAAELGGKGVRIIFAGKIGPGRSHCFCGREIREFFLFIVGRQLGRVGERRSPGKLEICRDAARGRKPLTDVCKWRAADIHPHNNLRPLYPRKQTSRWMLLYVCL